MKIAYLILTHNNQRVLERLINFLSCEDCSFFIHVDKKSDINAFSSIKGANVSFTSRRIPVYWAEFSVVDATLQLIAYALHSCPDYDYFVLLSGSDYPIQSRQYIHDFFEKHNGDEYISALKIYDAGSDGPLDGCARYAALRYDHFLNTIRIPSDKPAKRVFFKMLSRMGFGRRNYKEYLGSLEPYFGSMWWALTKNACRYVLDFVKANPSVYEYYKKTNVPDEMFFHTILGNSEFRSRIRKSLTYTDWSKENIPFHNRARSAAEFLRNRLLERSSNMGGHPAPLSSEHLDFFQKEGKVIVNDMYGSGEMLFARKVSDFNLDMVESLEEMILRRQRVA